jgi:hypothetical protein
MAYSLVTNIANEDLVELDTGVFFCIVWRPSSNYGFWLLPLVFLNFADILKRKQNMIGQCMLLRNLKDIKRIIRSRNSKNGRQYTDQTKQDTRLSTHHYLHNATQDTWRFSNKNLTKNRGLAVPAPLVSPVVLLLNDTCALRQLFMYN